MKMTTFGPVSAAGDDLSAAVKEAIMRFGAFPRLVILFIPASADGGKIVSCVRSVTDLPLAGATIGGAAFTENGITTDGIVGAVIGGESVSASCLPVTHISSGLHSAVASALSGVVPGSRPGHAVFVLSDAFACDGEALIKEVRQGIPSDWPVFGGFAGDSWRFVRTSVICRDDVFSDGAVIVYINDDHAPSVRARHGFMPAEGSREMKVTSAEGNLVAELDGRPAAEAYREELVRLGLMNEGESFIHAAAKYSLGIRSLWGEKLKIRTPLSESSSGIVFAGAVMQGSGVRVVVSSPEMMIDAAGHMMTDVIGSLGDDPSAVIVIDCAGRWNLLADRYAEQISAFVSGSRAPLIGFASYGEIAKSQGAMDGFHNTTSVAAAWRK